MLVADRIIALALMGFSLYLMWHATVLPIGWEDGAGPGGGAFPFWLSALMLLASFGIFLRSFTARAPHRSERFIADADAIPALLGVLGLFVAAIALIPIVGAYVALMAFMASYLRIFGHHGWGLIATLTIGMAVGMFFFFEVTLKILLPKGLTEPLFIPLYAIFF